MVEEIDEEANPTPSPNPNPKQVVEEIDEEEYKPEITTGIGEDAAKYAW